jgi:hypothetical protein
MKRQVRTTRIIPAHEVTETGADAVCDTDGCGVSFPYDYHEMSEIIIALDPDECVSYVWRRDYCPDHVDDIWDQLCAVLGVDPDAEGRHGYEDSDDGQGDTDDDDG